MAELHRTRACLVGTQEDMVRLCQAMRKAYDGGNDDDDEAARPQTLEEMVAAIHELAEVEGGSSEGFLYSMICPGAFGSAQEETTRFEVRREGCGLWTAVFAWDSSDAFQAEDWLRLHKRCGLLPMVAVYACDHFGLEKGSVLISNGHVMDNWDTMAEGWLYLIAHYECGYPPEEAVKRLKKLQVTLEREDYDQSIDELLESCENNLREIAAAVADPQALQNAMDEATKTRNWRMLLSCQLAVAEGAVWEVEHHKKWLANLASVRRAWAEA